MNPVSHHDVLSDDRCREASFIRPAVLPSGTIQEERYGEYYVLRQRKGIY